MSVERLEIEIDPKPSQVLRLNCSACNAETQILLILRKPSTQQTLQADPNQAALEGFPTPRFPVLGKKAPREVPFPCASCNAFTLRRRKSEPDRDVGQELRLYACPNCDKRTLTREQVWKLVEKSYIPATKNPD
jgi:hypothetical protein